MEPARAALKEHVLLSCSQGAMGVKPLPGCLMVRHHSMKMGASLAPVSVLAAFSASSPRSSCRCEERGCSLPCCWLRGRSPVPPGSQHPAPVGTGCPTTAWGCWAPQPSPRECAHAAAGSAPALNRASKAEFKEILSSSSDVKIAAEEKVPNTRCGSPKCWS